MFTIVNIENICEIYNSNDKKRERILIIIELNSMER